jgi:hypothetical protein
LHKNLESGRDKFTTGTNDIDDPSLHSVAKKVKNRLQELLKISEEFANFFFAKYIDDAVVNKLAKYTDDAVYPLARNRNNLKN